jgi:hypothetical protein
MSNSQSGSKVPDNNSYIKLFPFSQSNYINWAIKPINNTNIKSISPLTQKNLKIPFYIPNNLIVGGDLIVDGTIYTPSDERLKDNIEMIDDSELFTLNPMIFTYKNNENKKKHFGLLAQDVEKVYPELVEINNKGYKSVNYQELIPIMLSKMKKMQKEIDELKEKALK